MSNNNDFIFFDHQNDKIPNIDPMKTVETYQCPVYHSTNVCQTPVTIIDMCRSGISAQRWSLRGLKVTIRPY